MNNGWVKLHRQLLEWEWYDDIPVTRLFTHLLLTVNHKDNNWRGITIKKGTRLTSLDKLSSETKLSVSKIRTAIKKLKSTNEIASKSHSQHTVFTIVNYDHYQEVDKPNSKPVANESQTDSKRIATNKNDKNDKNDKKGIKYSENFLKIWEKYPNKDGKREANRHFLATVKCSEDFENIKIALNKYLKTKPVKDNFIKKGSTWFNQWEDYIEWVEPEANMKSEQDKLAERLGV